MQYIAPNLIAQNTALAELQARLRDSAVRWTAIELYRSMSSAVTGWSRHVSIPFIYTLSGGWLTTTHEYTIPDYMGVRIQPQRRITTTDNINQWEDIDGFSIEPDGSGGQKLRVDRIEGTSGATTDARILWWGDQGPLPSTIPTIQTQLEAAATSLILTGLADGIGQSGYIKVGNEWIQYAGYSHNGTYYTLTNLVRGINNTTDAVHASAVSVYFGIAYPVIALLEQLYNQAQANAHAYGLVDVNETERSRYEFNMRYFQQQADDFWRSWVPVIAPRRRIGRAAETEMNIGPSRIIDTGLS